MHAQKRFSGWIAASDMASKYSVSLLALGGGSFTRGITIFGENVRGGSISIWSSTVSSMTTTPIWPYPHFFASLNRRCHPSPISGIFAVRQLKIKVHNPSHVAPSVARLVKAEKMNAARARRTLNWKKNHLSHSKSENVTFRFLTYYCWRRIQSLFGISTGRRTYILHGDRFLPFFFNSDFSQLLLFLPQALLFLPQALLFLP